MSLTIDSVVSRCRSGILLPYNEEAKQRGAWSEDPAHTSLKVRGDAPSAAAKVTGQDLDRQDSLWTPSLILAV